MNRIILLVGILIISAIACRKDSPQKIAKLQIVLNQSVIAVADVDSAEIVLHRQNSSEVVTKKFTKNSLGLETDISDMASGNWTANVDVYTKTVNHESLQFVYINSVDLSVTPYQIQWDGPGSGNGWLKRHVKTTDGNGVIAIIPNDVYDPYIEFRFNDPQVKGFAVQRSAINDNYAIANKSWTCGSACINGQKKVINNIEFMPFTKTILSQPWTRNEISLSVFNQSIDEMLEWDFTWQQ